ncbi:unnamed protein product, partial [Ectocarpus sp. 4 AP-2014]
MLAQFSVPINTPLQDWIVQLKELVEGLSCFGDSCPTDAQIVSTAIEGLAVQYPEISLFVRPKLKKAVTLADMWKCFRDDEIDESNAVANAPPTLGTVSARSTHNHQPRVHAVVRGRSYE